VAVDLFEAGCLKVVEDVLVGEEPLAFAVSEHVCAIGNLNYACHMPRNYTFDSVKVLRSQDSRASHTASPVFSHTLPLADHLERIRSRTFVEGLAMLQTSSEASEYSLFFSC
jgi:hypothetical protein